MIEYMKNNPSWNVQEMPEEHFLVKEKLAERFQDSTKGAEFITFEEFRGIAKECKVTNETPC